MCPPDRALVVRVERAVSVPLVNIEEQEPSDEDFLELSGLVPKSFCVRHMLVPLRLLGERLVVAMARPEDSQALARLRLITRCGVQPFLAPPREVARAIRRLYR